MEAPPCWSRALFSRERRLHRSSAHILSCPPMKAASSELNAIIVGVLRSEGPSPELRPHSSDLLQPKHANTCIRKRLSSKMSDSLFLWGEGRLELVNVFQVMQAVLWLRDGDHILGLLVEEVGLVHVEGQINDLAWRMEIARVHTGNEFCCADFTVKHGFSTQ